MMYPFHFRNSEDTVLLVLKEIYRLYGLSPTLPGSESPQKAPSGLFPRPPSGNLPSYNVNQSAQPAYNFNQSAPQSYNVNQSAQPSFSSQPVSQPLQPPSGYSQESPQAFQQYNVGPPMGNTPSFSQGMPPQYNIGPPQTRPGANAGPPPMMGFVKASPKS